MRSKFENWLDILWIFLKIGATGFGGPIASMALLEQEFVRRRKWITEKNFTEIYTVLKILPGPLSTQMVIHLGHGQGGALGGVLAAFGFIFPAFFLLLILSFFYVHSGAVLDSTRYLGFQLGALVLIIQSTLSLAKPFRKKISAYWVAFAAMVLVYFYPRFEPLILIGFGMLGVLLARSRMDGVKTLNAIGLFKWSLPSMLSGTTEIAKASLWKVFWVCFKAGAFVFGSGLAIVPLLEGETVQRLHWLTHQQFMDGLALGQITPGPVVVTVTFIGYLVASFWGAVIATVGIFLPAFINVYFILPRIWRKVSSSEYSSYFTSFAIPAVIGAIFATTFRLAWTTLGTPSSWLIFLGALAVSFYLEIPSWLLILGSGALGFIHL